MKLSSVLLKFLLAVLLLNGSTAMPAKAQSRVYQWTDGNGEVHYSDSARGPAKSILIKPTNHGLDGGVSTAAIDDGACKARRDQLQRYSGASRVTETNALGETRDYGDAEIRKLIDTTEAAVRTACGEN